MTDKTPAWMARAKDGPKAIFATPGALWLACCEYFQWNDENPLLSAETVKFQGVGTTMDVPRMRAMTIKGLCTFLGVTGVTWKNYREREGFIDTCKSVEDIIYQQKITGAAADMLNSNIICRELGLADKKSQEITGKGGGPVATAVLDPEKYAEIRARMIADDDC